MKKYLILFDLQRHMMINERMFPLKWICWMSKEKLPAKRISSITVQFCILLWVGREADFFLCVADPFMFAV